jgi:hypothetical protein
MASPYVLGAKVRIWKRECSSIWQAAAYLKGNETRVAAKTNAG